MGIITDTADAVYANGPPGSPDQPDKSEIRGLFVTVDSQVVGAAAGMVRSTTLGGLTAGTRVGQPGQVTAGASKGEYLWNGSAWVYAGPYTDAVALQAGIDTNSDDIDTLDETKADAPATIHLGTYAGHNIAYSFSYQDYKPMLSFTEEGIPFDTFRNDLAADPKLAYALEFGDSHILGVAFTRDAKRPILRGFEQACDFPDLYHWGFYGQSNRGGADALPVVSGADQNMGNYKFACGIQTWNFIWGPTVNGATARGRANFDLVPLFEQDHQNGQGEFASTGISAQFKLHGAGGRYNTGAVETSKPHMLFSNSSTGGIYLSALMPADPEQKGYYLVFKDDILRAKEQASLHGMTYGFGGVLFEQGESEASSLKLTPTGSVQPFTTVQNTWRDNLIALRAAMETDVKAITGQTRAMPMFAACGRYPLLGNALKSAASLDPNIILTTPIHFGPNALNSQMPGIYPDLRKYGDTLHMTADGNRWFGAQEGKQMARVLKEGARPKVMLVKDVWRVSNTEIRVQFDVPYKPMKIDTEFVFPVKNMGLRVFAGTLDAVGALATITGTSIISDDTIAITLSTTIGAGSNFLVEYLGEKEGANSAAVLESIQDGAPYANGNTTKECVFNGDVRSQFADKLASGLFYLFQNFGAFNPIIRDMRFSGGKTILRGDASGFTVANAQIGQVVGTSAPFATGGICDSDPELGVYQFTDTTYGTNQGKYYPMWNYAFPFIEAVRT
jgi:hypothetical protein